MGFFKEERFLLEGRAFPPMGYFFHHGRFLKVGFFKKGIFFSTMGDFFVSQEVFSQHRRFFRTMGDFPIPGDYFLPREIFPTLVDFSTFSHHERFFKSWEIISYHAWETFPNMRDFSYHGRNYRSTETTFHYVLRRFFYKHGVLL